MSKSDVHNDKQLCIILGLVYLHGTKSDGLHFCSRFMLLSVKNISPPTTTARPFLKATNMSTFRHAQGKRDTASNTNLLHELPSVPGQDCSYPTGLRDLAMV